MKDIVMRLYDEVLNRGMLDVADEIISPDLAGGRPGAPGPEGIKKIYEHIHSGLPDMHFDVQDMIAEGDKVATRWLLTGTHSGPFFGAPPTGKQIEIAACVVFRIQKGQITDLWPVIDASALRP
jgi:steroid delta-isomerase-like uncharacterized protein